MSSKKIYNQLVEGFLPDIKRYKMFSEDLTSSSNDVSLSYNLNQKEKLFEMFEATFPEVDRKKLLKIIKKIIRDEL